MKNNIPSKTTTIIAFVLFLINATALMYFGKALSVYSGSPKLDFQLAGYDQTSVIQLFNEYGSAGRDVYYWLTVLDTPFPFIVAFFGYCFFAYTWKKWGFNRVYMFLLAASLSFCLFDNIENLFLYRMLSSYPDINKIEVFMSSFSTQIKLCSLMIVYLALPITLIAMFIKRRQRI